MSETKSLPKRLTRQLAARGVDNAKGVAFGILKKRGQMDSAGNLTSEGKAREALGSAGRAKDRAVKASGGKPADYTYDPKTNKTRKK